MRLVPYRRLDAPARYWPESGIFDSLLRDFADSAVPLDRDGVRPAVDSLEKEGNLILRAELPGMEEKDIELVLEGQVLTLRGERKLENEDRKENYCRIERRYGAFSRSFTLPDTADREKIHAGYNNGVLTVTIPQRPEAKPREIPVNTH